MNHQKYNHLEMSPITIFVQKKLQTLRKRETWKYCIYMSKYIICNDPLNYFMRGNMV